MFDFTYLALLSCEEREISEYYSLKKCCFQWDSTKFSIFLSNFSYKQKLSFYVIVDHSDIDFFFHFLQRFWGDSQRVMQSVICRYFAIPESTPVPMGPKTKLAVDTGH